MTRTIFFFPLFLLIITSYAQVGPFIITGQADSSVQYLILVKESNNGLSDQQDTIQVSSDKTFNRSVKINKPGKGILIYGNKTYDLWLIPDQSLRIDFTKAAAQFSGSAALFVKYYIDDQNFFKRIFKDYENKYIDFNKRNYSNEYFSISDSITNQRLKFLNNCFTGKDLKHKQEFVKQQQLSLVYSNLYYKTAFEGSKAESFRFYQEKYKTKNLPYYGFSDMVKLENKELLSNPYFKGFVVSFFQNLTRDRIKDRGMKLEIELFVDIAMTAIDDLVEEAIAASDLKVVFLNNIIDEIELDKKVEWVKKIDSTLSEIQVKTKSQSASFARKRLQSLLLDTKLNSGDIAPDFSLMDVSGKQYSLKDFRGKKIYMDLGASWCGPCIKSIPSWNKLVDEHKNNDKVIFLSLSIDNTKEEWEKFIKKFQIKGMKLYAGTGGFKSKFAIDYQVKGIPRFLLIDEEGRLMQFAASTPDSEEIRDLLR
jgi:thiol-disulfide isomerase/thioredoxin